ncbi:hypothetical protein L7F22_031532 [Adiantum nelumboides]|nr:hypothetical protein [Adiantum nelumboides]
MKMGSVEVIRPVMIAREPEHAVYGSSVHSRPSSQQGRASSEKIHVEDSAVLCSHWRDLALKLERSNLHPLAGAGDKRLPFLTDVLGCKVGCEAEKEDVMCFKLVEKVVLLVEKQFGFETESLALRKQTVM